MAKEEKSKTRRHYDADFKAEMIKKLLSGENVAALCRRSGIGENVLHRWKKEAKSDPEGKEKPVPVGVQALLIQIEHLQKQLKRVETERDILKKAVSIFSNSP